LNQAFADSGKGAVISSPSNGPDAGMPASILEEASRRREAVQTGRSDRS
jgi:hypothetical protein